MASRRQEKVARVIKEAVSDAIRKDLSDPRLEGCLISVTRIDISPDLKTANVYVSILAPSGGGKAVLSALKSASGRLKGIVGKALSSKFNPTLQFHEDEQIKKTMETMDIINKANPAREEEDIDDTEDIDE